MIFRINENSTPSVNKPKVYGAIYEEGIYVKDCDYFVTEQMINEYCGNEDLIRQAAILEGAKIDMTLKNYMKEGKDYKGLKKDLRDIIKYNNVDKDKLITGRKGIMHACKRIIQVLLDLEGTIIGAGTAVGVVGYSVLSGGALGLLNLGVYAIPMAIIAFIVTFLIGRPLRLLCDTVEFAAVKRDAKEIVNQIRELADKADDKKQKEKFNKEADRLEASIKKYSNKGDYDD